MKRMRFFCVAVMVGVGLAGLAEEVQPVWDLAKDAGELSVRLKMEGSLPLDSAHAFDLPAIADLNAFTVEVSVQATKDVQRRRISLLDQSGSDSGWALESLRWSAAGNPLTLKLNGTSFDVGNCVMPTNSVSVIALTVRDGLARVYFNGQLMKRFFVSIRPSAMPIRVGRTKLRKRETIREVEGLRLKSLKIWNGDWSRGVSDESLAFEDAFRGGPGWLVNCPVEDPAHPLPRILCFGDEILEGYGPRLRERLRVGS